MLLNFNLLEANNFNLEQVSKSEATKSFKGGQKVYVKVADTIWFEFDPNKDEKIDNFEYGVKYYLDDIVDDDIVIVSRHKNIVEYLKSKGIKGRVFEVAREKDVIGKKVYGQLPMSLACLADEYYSIVVKCDRQNGEFDDLPYTEFENYPVFVYKIVAKSEIVNL